MDTEDRHVDAIHLQVHGGRGPPGQLDELHVRLGRHQRHGAEALTERDPRLDDAEIEVGPFDEPQPGVARFLQEDHVGVEILEPLDHVGGVAGGTKSQVVGGDAQVRFRVDRPSREVERQDGDEVDDGQDQPDRCHRTSAQRHPAENHAEAEQRQLHAEVGEDVEDPPPLAHEGEQAEQQQGVGHDTERAAERPDAVRRACGHGARLPDPPFYEDTALWIRLHGDSAPVKGSCTSRRWPHRSTRPSPPG